ncbi:hypothetical protein, partial [Paenibacillus durus]|uniref:hypothetical protein n=1 Tax=Paenibacillus durus TaxID=44251 RepID=UPI00046EF1DD
GSSITQEHMFVKRTCLTPTFAVGFEVGDCDTKSVQILKFGMFRAFFGTNPKKKQRRSRTQK